MAETVPAKRADQHFASGPAWPQCWHAAACPSHACHCRAALSKAFCNAAKAPLDIVQIDHTKVDVTVVDPVTRLPIGRPTLTLGIDVSTRMAMGFYLSLEAPSLTAVALCLAHAVIDKTAWLASRGIAGDWPAHGIPRTIHVDNGAEFHARAFERACGDHRIDVTCGPPGTPRFGGHIERLIGTMMGAVHLIPGSHFSNIRERGEFDPEAEAVMTLRELETYLAHEIVGSYHARIHKTLALPPVHKRARIRDGGVSPIPIQTVSQLRSRKLIIMRKITA